MKQATPLDTKSIRVHHATTTWKRFRRFLFSLSLPRLSLGAVKMFSTFLRHPFFSYVFVFHDRRPKRWRAVWRRKFFSLFCWTECVRGNKKEEEEEEEKLNSHFGQQQWEHLRSILISDGKVNFPISRRRRRQRPCMCVHEEQFTTRSVENLVEIVKNFNDTTGFIFSTAQERRKVLHHSGSVLFDDIVLRTEKLGHWPNWCSN